MSSTADKLVAEARRLIVDNGYHGFSYAHLSARLGISKASIHHHFPSKVDLVVAVLEQQRAGIRSQMSMLEKGAPAAIDQLLAYLDYWKRCILDRSASFCLVGVLAAELPGLPTEVGTEVQGFFSDLRDWLERVLSEGVRQGSMRLENAAGVSADAFLAAIYGAMLIARAFGDPSRFGAVTDAFIRRIAVDEG